MTTITSAVEAAFVGEQSPFTGWIGGTDNELMGLLKDAGYGPQVQELCFGMV